MGIALSLSYILLLNRSLIKNVDNEENRNGYGALGVLISSLQRATMSWPFPTGSILSKLCVSFIDDLFSYGNDDQSVFVKNKDKENPPLADYCNVIIGNDGLSVDRRSNKSTLSIVEFNAEWLYLGGGKGSIRCPGIKCPWKVIM